MRAIWLILVKNSKIEQESCFAIFRKSFCVLRIGIEESEERAGDLNPGKHFRTPDFATFNKRNVVCLFCSASCAIAVEIAVCVACRLEMHCERGCSGVFQS